MAKNPSQKLLSCKASVLDKTLTSLDSFDNLSSGSWALNEEYSLSSICSSLSETQFFKDDKSIVDTETDTFYSKNDKLTEENLSKTAKSFSKKTSEDKNVKVSDETKNDGLAENTPFDADEFRIVKENDPYVSTYFENFPKILLFD